MFVSSLSCKEATAYAREDNEASLKPLTCPACSSPFCLSVWRHSLCADRRSLSRPLMSRNSLQIRFPAHSVCWQSYLNTRVTFSMLESATRKVTERSTVDVTLSGCVVNFDERGCLCESSKDWDSSLACIMVDEYDAGRWDSVLLEQQEIWAAKRHANICIDNQS